MLSKIELWQNPLKQPEGEGIMLGDYEERNKLFNEVLKEQILLDWHSCTFTKM